MEGCDRSGLSTSGVGPLRGSDHLAVMEPLRGRPERPGPDRIGPAHPYKCLSYP